MPHWSANSRWSCERSSFSYACSRYGDSRDQWDTPRGFVKGRTDGADLGNNWCWGKLCRFIFRYIYIYMRYIYIKKKVFFSNDDLNLVRTVRGKHTHTYIYIWLYIYIYTCFQHLAPFFVWTKRTWIQMFVCWFVFQVWMKGSLTMFQTEADGLLRTFSRVRPEFTLLFGSSPPKNYG